MVLYFQVPHWFDHALANLPMNANLLDFHAYLLDHPEIHDGTPFKFLTRNQRQVMLAIENRRRTARLAARHARGQRLARDTWVYEMNEIDKLGICPFEIDGLEEWDYGSRFESTFNP